MTKYDLHYGSIFMAKSDKIIIQPETSSYDPKNYLYLKVKSDVNLETTNGIIVSFSKNRIKWSADKPRGIAWILENYEEERLTPVNPRNRLEEVE